MIRRTFKARVPRNLIINLTYKVWWNLNYTSIYNYSSVLLQEQVLATKLNLYSTNRQNIIIGNVKQFYKPTLLLNLNIGYQPLRLNINISNKYQAKTSWQTNTRFVNCFNRAAFQFLINITNLQKQTNTFLLTTIYNNLQNSKILTTQYSNFFYQTMNIWSTRQWRINKSLNLFKWYSIKSARWYSERERFMRVLVNRNPVYLKHFQLISKITQLKL